MMRELAEEQALPTRAGSASARREEGCSQGMQQTVVGDDGAAEPVGTPPSKAHEPPLATSAPTSITLPGSDRPPQTVGNSFIAPVCPHPSCRVPVQDTPVGAPQVQGVQPRLSATPPYTVRWTEYAPPGHATSPAMKTQRRGSIGAAGAGAQTCPAAHPTCTGTTTDSHARAARPQPATGTTVDALGEQLPPCACGDAPMPRTFAHCPWTLMQTPAETLTLSHALVHPVSLKTDAVKLDGQDAPVS
jgi:hypothetical protein